MEQTALKPTPPAKRQRSNTPASTVDNATRAAGPVATLLNVPLSVIFQLQPVSNSTPNKAKEKPLLSRAEVQAFLQVHYNAQDMDALVATSEAAFRQKLKHLEYEQSICRGDHPMTRSLLPLLRSDPCRCLKYIPSELNSGILSDLKQVGLSLQNFGDMNATTADDWTNHSGMELIAEGKYKLSELQMELSKRIAALLAHEITEETNWGSMEEYCQRLFPNQCFTRVEEEDQVNETPEKINAENVVQQGLANANSLQEALNMVGENENDIDSTVVNSPPAKMPRDPVLDKSITFQEEEMTTAASSSPKTASAQDARAAKTPEGAHEQDRALGIALLHHAIDNQIPMGDGISTTAREAECMKQKPSSPVLEKQQNAPTLGTTLAAKTCETARDDNLESGIALLHQAVDTQIPVDTNSVHSSAATKTKDDLLDIDKENSQSQHSQNNNESVHPTLLIYGSQVSHASSSLSLTCRRPGAETQTAAALLSHFARSNESMDVMQE